MLSPTAPKGRPLIIKEKQQDCDTVYETVMIALRAVRTVTTPAEARTVYTALETLRTSILQPCN